MKLPRTSKHCSVPRICTKVVVGAGFGCAARPRALLLDGLVS